jgi:hypothetical protein
MRTDPTPEPGDRDQRPFSNSDHGEYWLGNVCAGTCIHDAQYGLRGEELGSLDPSCPLITLAMVGVTPHDWVKDGELGTTCASYEDGDRTPAPEPVVAVDLFGVYASEPVTT